MKKKSTSCSAFLNLCVLLGLFAFIVGSLLAVFAAPALGRIRRSEANQKASIGTTAGMISGENAEGDCLPYVTGTGTIVPGTNDIGNHCDDCTTTISLPFGVDLFGSTFDSVVISSNGNLQFTGNTAYGDALCPLPESNLGMAILPYQGDLRTDQTSDCSNFAGGCGIFSSVSGTAPNRVFNIEWRTAYHNRVGTANFEVRLYENRSNFFDVLYGIIADLGYGEVTGVQESATGCATTFSCFSQPLLIEGLTWTGGATPTPTPTPTGCNYAIAFGSDAIVPGNTDTGNHCAWCDTTINLPFPFVLYDQTFNAVMVNSSGRLDFVCNNEPSNYTETCLPASPNNCPYDYTIFALWGEWYTGTGATGCSTWANGCGIFTSVSGTAPNRIFNIEWHAVSREDDRLTANFEVRLYENDPSKRFDVIYGVIQQRSAYYDNAGVQGPTGSFTQDFCNVPPPQNVSSTYTMPSCVTPTPTATPTTLVTNTNDNGPGSLRQALADAHNGDTINFNPVLNGRNIGLRSGELVIDKDIIIDGPGPNLLGIYRSSQTSFRIMHAIPGVTATIDGLTISGGSADGDQRGGGGILNDHAVLTTNSCAVQNSFSGEYNNGGGIYNDGSGGSATMTILNSTVSGNYAYYAGGGIYNDPSDGGSATLTITNSTVSNNVVGFSDIGEGGGEGGGIYNGYSGGTLMITNSAVSNNRAGVEDPFPAGYGGGISNGGTLTITNSTINGNQVYLTGGGIANWGTLTITNSTVSGNRADGQHDGQPWGRAGGISGTVTLTNSTLSGNYASLSGGGIDGNATLGNTILNANAPENISGGAVSDGYNLSSDDGGGYLNGPGDQINTDPLLGPLQNNGGPTLTHALLPGSPAINTGDPNFTPPPSYDQRDNPFVRVYNGRIDIGSFEAQPPRRATPAPRSRPTPLPRPTPPR
jgi:hypothetical protein